MNVRCPRVAALEAALREALDVLARADMYGAMQDGAVPDGMHERLSKILIGTSKGDRE